MKINEKEFGIPIKYMYFCRRKTNYKYKNY